MIDLAKTNNPSPYIRNRSKRMWVRTLAPDSFMVKPREKGKARRIVSLLQNSSGIYIECRDKDTGKPCEANAFRRHCGHVEAAIRRLLINAKREANRTLKENK